jgi:RNA recognition motif-containing protein
MPEAKVYVGNLDPDATDRDIYKEFARMARLRTFGLPASRLVSNKKYRGGRGCFS